MLSGGMRRIVVRSFASASMMASADASSSTTVGHRCIVATTNGSRKALLHSTTWEKRYYYLSTAASSLRHYATETRKNSATHDAASTHNHNNNNNSKASTDDDDDHGNKDPYISGDKTHFGYEQVDVSSKQERVKQVFEGVADSYDVMNDFMSMGLHRLWKDAFVDKLALTEVERELRRMMRNKSNATTTTIKEDAPAVSSFSILDVAGGTGDIAFRMARACPSAQITVCDINNEMLRVGKSRAKAEERRSGGCNTNPITFQQGNAQDLHDMESNQYDIYTIAFGLRNVTDVDAALREACRVLKPGGRFLCLEFSPYLVQQQSSSLLLLQQQLYNIYSFQIIPQIGKFVANEEDSYGYLVESIRRFSTPTELQTRMERAGMVCCSFEVYTQGVVAVHEGWKSLY